MTLPPEGNALNARRMAVLWTFCEPSLCRDVHRALWRSVWLDVTPIIAATICHQRNYVERYSRYKAATLGVSVASPNWHGDKFASILDWAATKFETIRIDVTDALYRHNFMAEGATPQEAETRAQALGTLWLARHQDMKLDRKSVV